MCYKITQILFFPILFMTMMVCMNASFRQKIVGTGDINKVSWYSAPKESSAPLEVPGVKGMNDFETKKEELLFKKKNTQAVIH